MSPDECEPVDERIARALRGEASDAERSALAAWRRASPEHERQYRHIERLVAATRGLRTGPGAVPPRPTAAAIIAATAGRGRAARRLARWTPWAAVAAAVVLLVAINLTAGDPPSGWTPAEIVTGEGELATVKLADGSVVRLGPSSRLHVEAGRLREVRLEGRAFFAVAPVSGQPFRVHTSAATANVLGTRFELSADAAVLRLKVIEGRVALEAPRNSVEVAAGEESGVRDGMATPPTPLAEEVGATPWLGRFMVFQATPLRDVAREIERLYDVRVTIADPALGDATITATFTDSPVEDVVAVVCEVLSARCASDDGTFSIRR
jgi:transmembrane sensor